MSTPPGPSSTMQVRRLSFLIWAVSFATLTVKRSLPLLYHHETKRNSKCRTDQKWLFRIFVKRFASLWASFSLNTTFNMFFLLFFFIWLMTVIVAFHDCNLDRAVFRGATLHHLPPFYNIKGLSRSTRDTTADFKDADLTQQTVYTFYRQGYGQSTEIWFSYDCFTGLERSGARMSSGASYNCCQCGQHCK